nr:MAG TPA: hypothetical protein [Caudoviricetes sp.]
MRKDLKCKTTTSTRTYLQTSLPTSASTANAKMVLLKRYWLRSMRSTSTTKLKP